MISVECRWEKEPFIRFQPLKDCVKIGTYRDDDLFRSTELLQLPRKTWLLPASECEDYLLLHLDYWARRRCFCMQKWTLRLANQHHAVAIHSELLG